MTAEKENKAYTITEEQKATYMAEGFDIRDDEGNMIAYGAGKTVAYEDYMKVVKENMALKEELDKQRVSNASEEQLEAGTSAKAASKKKAVE